MGLIDSLNNKITKLKNFIFHPPVDILGKNAIQWYNREMEDNINLWYSLFINLPPWRTERIRPLGLPAAICREFANPTMLEFAANITGSARADFLSECFQDAQVRFRSDIEMGLALGGVAFKPYPFNGRILIDASSPIAFAPLKFDEAGTCICGAFKSKPVRSGKDWYVKIEYHELSGYTYTIRNQAYLSNQNGGVGYQVPLTVLEEWSVIEPEVSIAPVEWPLFTYFKPPVSNNIDVSSDIGVSIYSGAAVELIKQADEQWEALNWEYYSGRRKIYIDQVTSSGSPANMFDRDLFVLGLFSKTGSDFFHEYTPEFRDEPLYRGFQNKLKEIEFQVGLAYGTISDPQTVDKTATEVRNSKQRMYVTVHSIQENLKPVFKRLLYAMNVYTSLYGLAPEGDYEVEFDFGDSILNDEETRRMDNQDMRADVAANLIRPELYIMKKYNVSEEEAISMMPKIEDMITEDREKFV